VLLTGKEVQDMIDAAIRRHNQNASVISTIIGQINNPGFDPIEFALEYVKLKASIKA
jgi:hypothetical protein